MKKRLMTLALVAVAAMASCGEGSKGKLPAYLDDTKSIETRIDDALKRMTLTEKIDMLHAQSKFSSGSAWAFHNYVLLTEQECGATIYEVLINV